MGSLIQSFKTDRAKIYATVTGLCNLFLYPFIGPTISKIVYRMALWNAHYVFVQNQNDEQIIKKLCRASSKVVRVGGSGVDIQKFGQRPMPKSPKIKFLIASRFIDNKGLKELFTATINLTVDYSERFELHVAGDFELSKASKKLRKIS